MKFAILSDTHYISRRMIADTSDEELLLQPAVSEQAVRQAAELSDTLFIIGDLTDSGDRYSHEDFASFLHDIKESGKKVYVIFATHDFHHHKAYVRKYGEKRKYSTEPWNKPFFDKDKACYKDLLIDSDSVSNETDCVPELVEALSPEEIWELYKEFGPDEAYSVNEADFSYCLDLDENTRCLMLNDFFRNEEALKDKSPTYSPACFRWIKQMFNEAKRDGKYIFICSHHPFMPAVPAHRIGAGKENRDMRSPVVGHTLADMGFNFAFTGHSHFCNAGYLKSPEGNILYDVTVPSVRFYPPAFRLVDMDPKNENIKYNCIYIDVPEGSAIKEESLFEHYHRKFYDQYYHSVTCSNAIVKKLMDNARISDIYFLVKNKAKLTGSEYAAVKDVKLFDFIIEIAFNMLIGDGKYTPDTPEYRIMMPLCAKLDSIVNTQPFIDIKTKFLGGYSVSEIIEPMLFNNSVPDREAEINAGKEPVDKTVCPVYSSHAGDAVMAVIYLLAVLISFSAPAVAAIGIPILTLKKKFFDKNGGPLMKYR